MRSVWRWGCPPASSSLRMTRSRGSRSSSRGGHGRQRGQVAFTFLLQCDNYRGFATGKGCIKQRKNQYCGSGINIPDPDFSPSRSSIQQKMRR